MSLAVRVIARLDIKPSLGCVKGVRYEGLRRVGDPLELAAQYEAQGADEILYLDTTASLYGRVVDTALIRRTNEGLSTPLTAGGGIRSVADFAAVLRGGAEKGAMNTAALARPALIEECARAFGSQAVVVSLEIKRTRPATADVMAWEVFTRGGREPAGCDALGWAQAAVRRGAGELLVTSVEQDGTRAGYDCAAITALRAAVPGTVLTASGGCGRPEDVVRVLQAGASAVAVGTYLHGGGTVAALKRALAEAGWPVRA